MHCRCTPQCPCKYDPVVLPVRERVCDRYYPVEQPVQLTIFPSPIQILTPFYAQLVVQNWGQTILIRT